MSHKAHKISGLLEGVDPRGHDARYAGYFVLFNCGKFYEAHDVLEDLWLPVRKGQDGDFYKGLIQLAGAFVHLQKERLRPAGALFKLARTNLGKYGAEFQHLDLNEVAGLIDRNTQKLEFSEFSQNPLRDGAPQLSLNQL